MGNHLPLPPLCVQATAGCENLPKYLPYHCPQFVHSGSYSCNQDLDWLLLSHGLAKAGTSRYLSTPHTQVGALDDSSHPDFLVVQFCVTVACCHVRCLLRNDVSDISTENVYVHTCQKEFPRDKSFFSKMPSSSGVRRDRPLLTVWSNPASFVGEIA